MSDLTSFKIHNNQRTLKRNKKDRREILTPPKLTCRSSKINTFARFETQMGYDYESDNRTLKWMKEEYHHKMAKYLGKATFCKKQSRMDKVRIKEELNFKNEVNPLVKIFTRVNKKMEKGMLWDGMTALKM